MMDCLGTNSNDDGDGGARCSATTEGSDSSCMCASPLPYKRLEDEKSQRPVKITFYKMENSDRGKVLLPVERHLTVVEVCKLVSTKMGYNTTAFWSMVEYWVDKKAERVLEEHEIMADVYNEMVKFKRRANVRYVLRQVISKFDFLSDPCRIRNEGGVICENPKFFDNYHEICYIETVVDSGVCPVFFSRAGLQIESKNMACFLLLRDQKLYYTADESGMQMIMQLGEMYIRRHFYTDGPILVQDIPGIVLIGKLSELHVYRVEKDRPDRQDHLLLRPAATPLLRTEEITEEPVEEEPYVGIPVLPKALIRLTSLSDNFATTWIALMRLAKYGKQLRENYRAFKNKNDTSTREFSRANVPNQKPQSPLFRRRGCREHLGDGAYLRRHSHDHLALLDFSGRDYRSSSRRVSAVEQSIATESTSDAGNETQPPILERVDEEKSQSQKTQVVDVEDEKEEDFPNFALIGADGEFIHDYYPEHLSKEKK